MQSGEQISGEVADDWFVDLLTTVRETVRLRRLTGATVRPETIRHEIRWRRADVREALADMPLWFDVDADD